MRLFLSGVLLALIASRSVTAQVNPLFAPFDCRKHTESFDAIAPSPFVAEISDSEDTIQFVDDFPMPDGPASGWQDWSYVENFAFGKDRGSMSMITDLRALHPYFRDQISALIRACKAKGIEIAVVETYRTHAKQNEYKGMGKGYTNSGAGKSKHQYGLAVDVVPVVRGVAVWNNVALWKKVGTTGEKLGLRWGGRWRRPYDPGHFEWTGGTATASLHAGTFPEVPAAEKHYPCLQEDVEALRRNWNAWETAQSSLTRK
jgi:hypothetical protein